MRTFALKARRLGGDDELLKELNDEQRSVVTAPGGPMLVIAGAGSGKTRALTHRLAWLVQSGVDPSHLMLATFTNRAAREMLHRVELLIKSEIKSVWGGTFHHLANRVLRTYGARVHVPPDFTILDREDAKDLMKSCIDQSGVNLYKSRFPHKGVLVEMSSFTQNTLEPLDSVLEKRYPMFRQLAPEISRVIALYMEKKRVSQVLDYDDLLTSWLGLLNEHEDIAGLLANQFQHILVDEYQDTNAIQAAIVDKLAAKHRNVCVVGDDSQSIYSFRGARFENMIQFRDRYPDVREYRLETNYRSTPEILDLANHSIARNTRRLPKELRAVRPSGLKPAFVSCTDHYTQSRFIAEYILHLLDEGRAMRDVAVLYRSHWHSLEIQLELKRHNVPFQVRGGLRFFEQAHIKDVLSFLRVLQNPGDEVAWFRVLPLLPRVGTGLTRKLWTMIAGADNPVEAACDDKALEALPSGAREFYRQFSALLRKLSALRKPAEMIDLILDEFYQNFLSSHYDGASLRLEDLKGLANFAAQYNTLEAFLADIALSGEFTGETVVTGPEEQEFVILSTVHQAKGLEWPVVLIPWLADGRFPTDFMINSQEDEEEERRVFHVAVTRAKDELYLITPKIYRSHSGGLAMMKPSRFLTELDQELVEVMRVDEGLSQVTSG